MHHPPDARNSRYNSSSEHACPVLSKMKRHRHLTVLEWHEPSGVVSFIDLDRLEVCVQQRHVVDVSETIRYRGAVSSANWEGPQQRCEIVTDYARLHNVCIDVDGIEPLSHAYHFVSLFAEGVLTIRSLFGRQNHAGRRRETVPTRLGWTYVRASAGGVLTTDGRNPNMVPTVLWCGIVNSVPGVMCSVIF